MIGNATIRMIIRRLLLSVPLLFVVSVLTFGLVALTPGNPALEILGGSATPAEVTALDQQLGLNQPLVVQYWQWLVRAVHGNLGVSLYSSQTVTGDINSRIGVTLTIVIGAVLVSTVLGVALGIVSAVRGGWLGRLTDVVSLVGFAVPNFWLGLILVTIFSVKLGLVPATGFVPFSTSPNDWLDSIILPVITLAAVGVTGVAKQTRDSLRDVLGQPFIVALRAEGVPERTILLRHALKNAALPVVTMMGLFFVGMLGGAVIVEQVFGLPGVGSLAVSATSTHDLPVVQGVVLYFTIIVIAVNLILDVTYGLLNPRGRVS
jgi:peptide/nickel transport system permease protein